MREWIGFPFRADTLPYRHHDHAGNFADVHKHWLLCLLFEHLLSESAPLHYLESHAGAGRYRCGNGTSDNFASGIAKVWQQPFNAPSVTRYRKQVTALNTDGRLTEYPGSPIIAAQYLRAQDRGVLVEKASGSFAELAQSLDADPRFTLLQGDGPLTIAAYAPTDRRYLLLVDPPFTEPAEFSLIAEWLPALLHHRSGGTIALWHPVTGQGLQQPMLETLDRKIDRPVLHSAFVGKGPRRGMYGSGMLIFNPPSFLAEEIRLDGPELATQLNCEAVPAL